MFLMPLGLNNRPFVPHNLLPAQQSPVPLLKFQLAPTLSTLNASGPRKRNPATHVRVKPELHTRSKCRPKFHALLHTSYIRDCWSDLVPYVERMSCDVSVKKEVPALLR
jgi:hypothetical protein